MRHCLLLGLLERVSRRSAAGPTDEVDEGLRGASAVDEQLALPLELVAYTASGDSYAQHGHSQATP